MSPINKKPQLVLIILALIIIISGSAPKILNVKSLFSARAAIPLSLPANTPDINIPLASAPVPQKCDVLVDAYCIVSGNFIFAAPLDPDLTDPLAGNYRYAMDDNGTRLPHRGVDFAAAVGTPIQAAADGEIVFAGMEETRTHSPIVNYYGNFIVIRHPSDLYTLYAHLSQILVEAGQVVQTGEVIGEVGRTGAAIGSHVHFEVRRGKNGEDFYSTENPELWLAPQADESGTLHGAISITFDTGPINNGERGLSIEYYSQGASVPEKIIYTFMYPAGFENNLEDLALGNLQPGHYRIVVADSLGPQERWVYVESGKLTQVYMVHK